MRKLLFISTINLTTNPRLLKEIKLAAEDGRFDVSFIGFKLGDWSDALEEKNLASLPQNVKCVYMDASRQRKGTWLKYGMLERLYRGLYACGFRSTKVSAWASNRRSIQLNDYLNKHKPKTDYVIAHTLGTLYPAWRYTRNAKVKLGFDLEDYHPDEVYALETKGERTRRLEILRKTLPDAEYISLASPLFESAMVKDGLVFDNVVPVHNCFDGDEFVAPSGGDSGKLRLAWFSQNVTFGRGLEELMPVLRDFEEDVMLTLYGNMDPHFAEHFAIHSAPNVETMDPLPQSQLHAELSKHHVGISFDTASSDPNRDIAFTNKMWAYFQAGLFLWLSPSTAHSYFLDAYPARGATTALKPNEMKKSLESMVNNRMKLGDEVHESWTNAKPFGWETESMKLVNMWLNLE